MRNLISIQQKLKERIINQLEKEQARLQRCKQM